jgi:hypothetical protein
VTDHKRKGHGDYEGMPWWRCPAEPEDGCPQPHEKLERIYQEVQQDQAGRYEAYREYERMFGADNVQSGTDEAINLLLTGELKQNELANTLETLHAQVFKNIVVPAVATSEADYDEWFRAKAFGRWIEGVLDDGEVFDDAVPKAGLYALVYGTGPIKVIGERCKDRKGKKRGKVHARAINPKYLLVDRTESKHGRPRTLFQKDHVDRWQLMEEYGKGEGLYGDAEDRKEAILGVRSNDDEDLPSTSVMKCDMVTVKEAWHLPSSASAKDGKHCIWVTGCTLVYEEFGWDTFPFVFIRFGNPLEGFWGVSAVKRLAGIQEQLDKLNKKIDESQDVMGVPRILVRRGANIKKADIDDIPGGILECDDINGIKDWNAQCVTGEVYQERDAAPHKMRSLLGVSDFEVQQQIPQGMRDVSGAFLERWVDQGQARHAMFHKDYVAAICKLAKLYVFAAEELEEAGYDVVAKAPGGTAKSSIETLKFSEVKIDLDRLKLRVLPMSQLPTTFAGKVEAIQKLKDLMPGLAPQTIARMTEVPDVNGTTDMLVSDEEIIMKNICWMVKNKKYKPPLPFDNHDLIIQMVTRFINTYRVRDDADIQVQGALMQYMEEAIEMKRGGGDDPNAPPMDPMAAGGMPPGGPPPMPGPGGPPMPGMPGDMGPMAEGMPPDPGMMGGPMGDPMGMPPPGMPPEGMM